MAREHDDWLTSLGVDFSSFANDVGGSSGGDSPPPTERPNPPDSGGPPTDRPPPPTERPDRPPDGGPPTERNPFPPIFRAVGDVIEGDMDVVAGVATKGIALVSGAAAAGASALGDDELAGDLRGAEAAADADADRRFGEARQKFEDAAGELGWQPGGPSPFPDPAPPTERPGPPSGGPPTDRPPPPTERPDRPPEGGPPTERSPGAAEALDALGTGLKDAAESLFGTDE